jgi:ubiquinol-cytochrome c reductase cytochrome c subunit
MTKRLLRRILVPFAVVVVAAAIGIFVIGRSRVPTTAMANPGIELTSSASSSIGNVSEGHTLFEENCSACHGSVAQGSQLAPNLRGRGAAIIDLWLSTGWMPLAEPTAQPENKPPRFTKPQILDIVAFVTSLAPGGVGLPSAADLDLRTANVAQGFDMFSLNCAACHTITGAGDALASGYHAPSLHGVTASEVYEAVRTGPSNMPPFGPGQITPVELKGIIKYVTNYIDRQTNPGGIGLGGVGPVAEGFVGLFVGTGACLLAAYWVGDRTEREDEGGHGEGADGHGAGTGDGSGSASGVEGAHA